jgi:hypothetical protein
VLADEQREEVLLPATELVRVLEHSDQLRLVVLNSCETAHSGGSDSLTSTASILVRDGKIPAVLAMQYPFSDPASRKFAGAFYGAIADRVPIDAALTEARIAISNQNARSLEWATPVLIQRSPDGVLFDIKPKPPRWRRAQVIASMLIALAVGIGAGAYHLYSTVHTIACLPTEKSDLDLTSLEFKDNQTLESAFDNCPPLRQRQSDPLVTTCATAGDACKDAVRLVQESLNDLGYRLPHSIMTTGKFDGVFGSELESVVTQFQADNGLCESEGSLAKGHQAVVGRQTLGKLEELRNRSGRSAVPGRLIDQLLCEIAGARA